MNLTPVIIQNAITKQVLMLGYMNDAAKTKTRVTGLVWFYSRSKQRLWQKGETSGNVLRLVNWYEDCDADAVLIEALPAGPTCHTNATSCFANDSSKDILAELYARIKQRQQDLPDQSYTASLFRAGLPAISAKVAEESAEVIQAATRETQQRVVEEACDVLYHLFVLCLARDVKFQEIIGELEQRRNT